MWDLTSPIFIVGVCCVLVSLGSAWAVRRGTHIPVLSSNRNQYAVLLVGISLIVAPQIMLHFGETRVRSIELFMPSNVDCDGYIPFRAEVRTAGGSGVVILDPEGPDWTFQSYTFGVGGAGAHEMRGRLRMRFGDNANAHYDTALYLVSRDPGEEVRSNSEVIRVDC
ncbi:hypothetical protein [Nocardia sp. SSK8]|uniref:hypothetical protein n=1 Tax=Nocardia sp. SSK8 TaxID=3120154 RepID=UPI00300BF8A6